MVFGNVVKTEINTKIIKIISDRAVLFQSGYLYHYAFVILIGLTIILTYLII